MPRRLIIILTAIVVLVVPAVIAALVLNRSPKLQNTVLKLANINTNENDANVAVNTNTTLTADTQTTADQDDITFASRNFAETYGSGSNQNDFSNIVESEKWTTKSYTDVLNRDIVRLKATNKTTPYHEILTKSLVVTFSKQTLSTAQVAVSTQRQETIGDDRKVYYQDILIDLVKVGPDWKVNAALWKPVIS